MLSLHHAYGLVRFREKNPRGEGETEIMFWLIWFCRFETPLHSVICRLSPPRILRVKSYTCNLSLISHVNVDVIQDAILNATYGNIKCQSFILAAGTNLQSAAVDD